MTKVLITGGGGMIGQKIAHALAKDGLNGTAAEVTLVDLALPEDGAPHAAAHTGTLEDTALVQRLVAARPDVIFHLAAMVSGQAEREFDAGWSANVGAMQGMLDALRGEHTASAGAYRPRLVFASSLAVFGGALPDIIPDDFRTTPQSSYGVQKVIGEQMVADYSRKGFVDGVSLRLPTISVRPGKPNAALSSCFSGIIREPLNGQEAVLPLPVSTRHVHASPRSATGFFLHAAALDTGRLEGVRAITMPGVSCTIEEQIEALRAVGGDAAVARIKPSPDAAVAQIVQGWPRQFDTKRATALGFAVEQDFREIVAAYVADDLQG